MKRPLASPIKAQTGTPAAGCALELATAALALHHGRIPASPNTPADALNVSEAARDAAASLALCPVFGLGGQNAAVVLRKPG